MFTSTSYYTLLFGSLLGLALAATALGQPGEDASSPSSTVVVEDFSSYSVGKAPDRWRFITSRQEVWPLSRVLDETRTATVRREGSRQFLRTETDGRALRITLRNDVDFDWSLDEHPRLAWDWRALHLPESAREDQRNRNDVGAAVYVTFGSDWLGRPISIKYTYSSTLPVGTVISQGPLRVLVIASGAEGGVGEWKSNSRNVIADYRQVFGGEAPRQPISITIWSDSDSVGDSSKADFDNIRLQPPR